MFVSEFTAMKVASKSSVVDKGLTSGMGFCSLLMLWLRLFILLGALLTGLIMGLQYKVPSLSRIFLWTAVFES